MADSEVSQEVQELVDKYYEGSKKSLDEAMTLIRAWLLSNDEGEGSIKTMGKLSEARGKCDVGLKFITQDWVKFNIRDKGTTSEELQKKWIDMPMFSLPLNKPGTHGNRMSGAISTTARADLKNYLKFEVRFESWAESFQSDIMSTDLPQISNSRKGRFLDAIAQMLESSARFNSVGEIQQLQQFADAIKDLLRVYGYDFAVKSPPAEDFSFYAAGTDERQTAFIHGEARKADNLPNRIHPPGTSAELCWFGFASFICRNPHPNPSVTSSLRKALQIGEEPKAKGTFLRAEVCSRLVWKLIKGKNLSGNVDGDRLRKVIGSILEKRDNGLVHPEDALSLWGAVMQACFETVAKSKRFSIVMSLKMMWFLRLGSDEEGRCIVFITDGIQMGSENANSHLLKFLTYVQGETMDDKTQRKWQDAIAIQNKSKTKSSRDNQKRGGQAPPSKQPRLNQEGGGKTGPAPGGSHKTRLLASQPNITRAVSFDSFDDPQGTDEYGIPIPYFDQIRDTIRDLGYGRCGTVREVRWENGSAAVKQFRHKGEDDRRLPDDIYEHELSVLRNLEPLWGVHVPRLLFHKPWPSNPAIGLQVGEPMQEDMNSWTEEERSRAALSLKKIREFGWVQGDYRGSNFVRLKGKDGKSWSIAAIDLEDMVRPGN